MKYSEKTITASRPERIISLLSSIADNELLSHKLYSELLQSSYAHQAPKLINSFQIASDEDLDHYNAIAECLERLKGTADEASNRCELENEQKGLRNRKGLKEIIKKLSEMELFAVKTYVEICSITLEYDYRTFDLSYRNMHENIHHLNTLNHLAQAQLSLDLNLEEKGYIAK